MTFRTSKAFADYIAALSAEQNADELRRAIKTDMVGGNLVLSTDSPSPTVRTFLERFAGPPCNTTDIDELASLAAKFEEMARGEGRELKEVAEDEIARLRAELGSVHGRQAKLSGEIVEKDRLIAELKASSGKPTDSTGLEDARDEREHQRKKELQLLAQEHERTIEVARAESALKLATEKAAADARATEAKTAADAALARERATKDEAIAKLQSETARAVAAETARDVEAGKNAQASARITRNGALVGAIAAAVLGLLGILIKGALFDSKGDDNPSRTKLAAQACDGFPGTWKRAEDAEVFQIAATTDCQLIVTAITPKYEQFLAGRVQDGTRLHGSLLRYQVADGCVVHLETYMDKISDNEIKQEVTRTTGNCPPVGPGYTERFILTRVN